MTIIGDPEGMRSDAALLRLRADGIASMGAQLRSGVDAMVYAGPAADWLRAAVNEDHERLLHVASRLDGLATTLARAASAVEAELRALGGNA